MRTRRIPRRKEQSRKRQPHRGGNKYIALDCEMVEGPRRKPMVAEVALVDWDGNVVYQTYVQPTGPVKDYRKTITGITPEMLTEEGGAQPFTEVQTEVLRHIQGKIVVGHALENDLKALQIRVPSTMMRNTAHHPFFQTLGPKGHLQSQKLSKLYETYVGNVEIQKGAHGATEDAAASMRLYKTYHNSWNVPVIHSGPTL